MLHAVSFEKINYSYSCVEMIFSEHCYFLNISEHKIFPVSGVNIAMIITEDIIFLAEHPLVEHQHKN